MNILKPGGAGGLETAIKGYALMGPAAGRAQGQQERATTAL